MSQLPQIDPAKVTQKILAVNNDLTYQVTQLEVLAEALRDERDEAYGRISELESQLEQAQAPVHDITTLDK